MKTIQFICHIFSFHFLVCSKKPTTEITHIHLYLPPYIVSELG